MDVKKLKKYGTNQLLLKVRKEGISSEDREVILSVLKDRGVDLSIHGLDKDPPKVENTPQEIIDFIDEALEKGDTHLCHEIGKILEDNNDYDSLSEEQVNNLLKLRDMAKKGQISKKEKNSPKVKGEKKVFTLNAEQKAILENDNLFKSERMRQLYDSGMTVAQISDNVGAHYSFVFGVIKRYRDAKAEKKAE